MIIDHDSQKAGYTTRTESFELTVKEDAPKLQIGPDEIVQPGLTID